MTNQTNTQPGPSRDKRRGSLHRLVRLIFARKHLRLLRSGKAYEYELFWRYPNGKTETIESGIASPGGVIHIGRGARIEHVEKFAWDGSQFRNA